jgi:hypothetical protein
MATGRTTSKYARFYADGYDLSGYARSVGELRWEFSASPDAALTDAVKNIPAVNAASIGPGTLNGFFDNTATSGLHAVASGAGVKRVVMIPHGIRAAPAQSDPVFCGEFEQTGYSVAMDNNILVANVPFGETDAIAAGLAYAKPWGVLLHAYGAETGANTATGVDDLGAASAKGGFLCYQIFSVTGTGSVTVKVQEADTNVNGSFADLSGATSGAIAHTAVPCAGIVALGTTAAVKRYLRWQIALVTITSVTFALAFVRGQ